MHSRAPILLLHRLSGITLASFVLVHLANHVVLVIDDDMAVAFMETFRLVYRWPPVEGLILAAVLLQLATGPLLARHRSSRAATAGIASRAASITGCYLLFFLVVHLSAVFVARIAMDIDTGFRFAAAGLQSWPSAAFFLPYYFLAVVAVFVHIGLAVARWRKAGASGTPVAWSALAGAVTASVIVGSLIGLA